MSDHAELPQPVFYDRDKPWPPCEPTWEQLWAFVTKDMPDWVIDELKEEYADYTGADRSLWIDTQRKRWKEAQEAQEEAQPKL